MHNLYRITHNPIELYSETDNTIHPLYTEAASDINTSSGKSDIFLKNMLKQIQSKSSPMDNVITASRGDITKIKKWDQTEETLTIVKKHVGSNPIVKNIDTIVSSIKRNRDHYVAAYDKNIEILRIEYDYTVYFVLIGISYVITNFIDVSAEPSGSIQIKPKKGVKTNVDLIAMTLRDIAKELNSSKHDKYLKEFIQEASLKDIKESTDVGEFTEGAMDTISKIISGIQTYHKTIKDGGGVLQKGWSMIKGGWEFLKRNLFGIAPILRSIVYFRYKKKASLSAALNQQAMFLDLNIEKLKNRTNIDPKERDRIVAKQQAIAEAYRKKAEKLRAELVETEKDAALAVQSDNKDLKSDDLVLESAHDNITKERILSKGDEGEERKRREERIRLHKKLKWEFDCDNDKQPRRYQANKGGWQGGG